MADAYVMRTCAACKHFEPIHPNVFGDAGECQNVNVPVTVVLAIKHEASRWGCILFESKLPADPPPTD